MPRVSKEILDQYCDPDKFFMVHEDDPDLDPIRVFLPKPPPLHLIEGYGLPAVDQKFKVHKYPQRLLQLDDGVKKRLLAEYNQNNKKIITGQRILEETLIILNDKRAEYIFEINWIYRELEFLDKGYWCYINGKPTYISKWHYFYCSFWKLDIGLPDYRDRDRRWFNFAEYCHTTKENEKGENTNFRTCFGFTYPKHRRDGATFKCLSIGYHIAMRSINGLFGIQSFNKDNAGDHFTTKLVPAWQKLPFFLKPMWSGSNDPAGELNFSRQSNKVLGNQLGSKINFATTASRSFYDGKKQIAHLSDENGKTKEEDVGQRHTVVKQTLAQGSGALIHGFTMHPTTVADMESGGGEAFNHLCNQSKFYERGPTGQTKSGLFRLFIPAYDGLEGFIGPYGESIIGEPTDIQKAFTNRDIGAKQYLEETMDELQRAGDAKSLRDLRQLVQLYPSKYDDCFRMTGGDVGFDVEGLDRRISELKRLKDNQNPVERGNFMWEIDGIKVSAKEFVDNHYAAHEHKGRVVWETDPNGNFEISKKLPTDQTNLKFTEYFMNEEGEPDEISFPNDIHGIVTSADPFQHLDPSLIKLKADGDTMSDGGGAAFWKRDTSIDPDSKPVSQWSSCRFILTYLARPKLDTYYAEEMLMMTIYCNGYMYPENNVKLILSHFVARGCKGYLMHKVDPVTKEVKPVAGFASLKESKDDLFKATRNHIAIHISRERHLSLVRQWREIKHIKQMTNYDLLTAGGGCLLAANNRYSTLMNKRVQNNKSTMNLSDIVAMHQ